MDRYKIALLLLTTSLVAIPAQAQEKADNRSIASVTATVSSINFVGNVINVKTDETQMSFSVPAQRTITKGSKEIGFMDIKQGDPVTIQYYVSSPGQNVVVSIVDNSLTNL